MRVQLQTCQSDFAGSEQDSLLAQAWQALGFPGTLITTAFLGPVTTTTATTVAESNWTVTVYASVPTVSTPNEDMPDSFLACISGALGSCSDSESKPKGIRCVLCIPQPSCTRVSDVSSPIGVVGEVSFHVRLLCSS